MTELQQRKTSIFQYNTLEWSLGGKSRIWSFQLKDGKEMKHPGSITFESRKGSLQSQK